MTELEIQLEGLKCDDSNELYKLMSLIADGYLSKRGIIEPRFIDDILEALHGVTVDLQFHKENILKHKGQKV